MMLTCFFEVAEFKKSIFSFLRPRLHIERGTSAKTTFFLPAFMTCEKLGSDHRVVSNNQPGA